jgi:hypothetical protein
MKRSTIFGLLAAGGVMVASGFAPISAQADSLQNDKNNMRNLAIVSGAAALLGLADHNTGLAVAGTVGAVIAGSQAQRDQQIENSSNCYVYNDGGRYTHNWNGDRNFDQNRDNDNRDRNNDNRDNDNRNWNGDQGRYNHGR